MFAYDDTANLLYKMMISVIRKTKYLKEGWVTSMKEECVICAEEFDVFDRDILEGRTGKAVCPKCKTEEEDVQND